MQLVNWLSHIIVFGGATPHLFLVNLPFAYLNPYGHPMGREALLLPAPSIALSKPGEAEQIQITAEAQNPWETGSGAQPFAGFLRSIIAPRSVNDRYRGVVSGNIEFHCPASPEIGHWFRNTYYNRFERGFVAVRCTKIELVKQLGYFQGNGQESVSPWYE